METAARMDSPEQERRMGKKVRYPLQHRTRFEDENRQDHSRQVHAYAQLAYQRQQHVARFLIQYSVCVIDHHRRVSHCERRRAPTEMGKP